MNLFLTNNIGGIKKENGIKTATSFENSNNFLNNLRNTINNYKKFVLMTSDPTAFEQNDKYLKLDIQALEMSNMKFESYLVIDNRSKNKIAETF